MPPPSSSSSSSSLLLSIPSSFPHHRPPLSFARHLSLPLLHHPLPCPLPSLPPPLLPPPPPTWNPRRIWHHTRAAAAAAESAQRLSVTTAADCRYGGKQVVRMNEALYSYILAHTREPQILRELREETSTMMGSQMQTSPEQAQFLCMLVQLIGAEHCIEVGVYTGYSSLAVALALPDCGHIVACEKDSVSLAVAKKYYEKAGVASKVDIQHGLALDTLMELIKHGGTNRYDFAFLDADKRKYLQYYELLLQLVRPGGLIVIDNVLWHGKVADPQDNAKSTESIRDFNLFILQDERVSISMVPVGDGMTLCRKRGTK